MKKESIFENKLIILLLFIVLIIATILRISYLGEKSLWFDEAFSIMLSKHNLKGILEGEKNNPPLYHFLLHYWIKLFGDSEFATRLMSAIFGIISIILLYKIGCIIFNPKVSLLSAFLLSLSPFHIHYSQEARMYSLVLLLTICSIYFFINFLKENKDIFLVFYGIFSILSIYTHYFAFFIIFAQNLFIIIYWKKYKKNILPWFLCQFLIALSFIPWIWNLTEVIKYNSREKYLSHLWIRIFYTFLVFNLGYSGIIINFYTKKHLMQTIFSHKILLFFVILVFCPIFILGIKSLLKRFIHWKIFIILYFFLPFICAIFISLKIPLLAERYFIVALPAYYFIISIGIMTIKSIKIRIAFFCGILFLTGFSLKNYYFNLKFGKGDWRSVASYIQQKSTPNDCIIFCPGYINIPFNYYFTGNINQLFLPEFYDTEQDIKNIIVNKVSENHNVVWFIVSHAQSSILKHKELLSRYYILDETKIFPMSNGIEVYLFKKIYNRNIYHSISQVS